MRRTGPQAPVAQLDRATASGAVGQRFESSRARCSKDTGFEDERVGANRKRITIEEATALLEAARAVHLQHQRLAHRLEPFHLKRSQGYGMRARVSYAPQHEGPAVG